MFRRVFIILTVLLVIAVFAFRTTPVRAATLTITTENDDTITDGFCSLREAILLVNGGLANDCGAALPPPPHTIEFAMTVETITVTSPLPPLTANQITIDGITNDTFGVPTGRTLSGTAGAGSGLIIESNNNLIIGLNFVSFPNHGIVIRGSNAAFNTIRDVSTGSTDANLALDPTLANGGNGIHIEQGAHDNIIAPGVDTPTILANNQGAGIRIQGIGGTTSPTNETRNNTISGVLIGHTPSFVAPNNSGVIIANGATGNTIGAAASNLIYFNTGSGVEILNAPNNTVQNNEIFSNTGTGVRLSGVRATNNTITQNNPIQAHSVGIRVLNGANNNTISTNIINANTNGIIVNGTGTSSNIISGNNITNNTNTGVRINNGATNNRIATGNQINNNGNGIAVVGMGTLGNVIRSNTITSNTQDGIVMSGNHSGNRIRENSIFSNGDLGIDLLGINGPDPNDANDTDTGPNQLHNKPVLNAILQVTDYIITGAVVTVRAGLSVDSGVNNPSILEFFDNPTDGPASNFRAGENYLFTAAGVPNGLNQSILLSTAITAGMRVTSTSTDTQANTSEFSNAVIVGELTPNFTWAPFTGVAPALITFDSSPTIVTTGSITLWAWDFQDDGIVDSTAQNPTFTYTAAGTYTVRLTVTHSSGITATVIAFITITGQTATPTPLPPTATFTTEPPTTIPPTATDTFTPIPTNTSTSTNTVTPIPTRTFTPIPTNTATPIPTNTPIPTDTATPTSTSTPIPTNTATLIPTDTITPIPTNTATLVPTITATPLDDIEIDKEAGDDDTIIITIDNKGDDLEDVILEEDLQEGVYYVSSVPGEPLCRESGGVITCTLGTIPGGSSVSVEINVDSEGVDIISGRTTVTSGGRTVAAIDEPYITKLNQPPFAAPGDELTYTIRVINPTTRTVTNVTVRDSMPDAIELESAEATSGRVQITGQNIVFTQASLAAGGRITITLKGRLREGQSIPQIVNRACLTTSTTTRPRCAVAGFFKASTLPRTGESSRNILLAAVVMTGIVLLLGAFFLRRRLAST